jgi:hypothetical protein
MFSRRCETDAFCGETVYTPTLSECHSLSGLWFAGTPRRSNQLMTMPGDRHPCIRGGGSTEA